MAPREAQGAWLHCGRGGNTLPLPMRLQAAGQTPTGLQLAGTLGCLRQLGGEILQMHATHAPALSGLPSLCAKGAAAMGAESAGLITAHQIGVESCLLPYIRLGREPSPVSGRGVDTKRGMLQQLRHAFPNVADTLNASPACHASP